MLYRDDDISVTTNIVILKKVHDIFIEKNKLHTVAVVMEDIWDNKEVWYFLMTARNLSIGLHGWDHEDYSKLPYDKIFHDLNRSIMYWDSMITRGGYEPRTLKTFYPPWNKTSPELESACSAFGLVLDNHTKETHPSEVYGFHYWTEPYEELRKIL